MFGLTVWQDIFPKSLFLSSQGFILNIQIFCSSSRGRHHPLLRLPTRKSSHTHVIWPWWHILQRGFLIMNETYKFNVSGVLQEHANVWFLHTGWIRRPHRFSLFRDMFEAVNGSSVFSWTSRTPLVLWCSIRLRFCVLFPFPCLWCPPLNTAAVRTQYKTDLWGDYL